MSKNTKLGWSFTSPYLIFTLIFFLLPLFWSFWLALTSWNMISPTVEFVGFQNFIDAIKSPAIQSAFVVTYKFLIIFCTNGAGSFDGDCAISQQPAKAEGVIHGGFLLALPVKRGCHFFDRQRIAFLQRSL